ncbi:MAG: class I SAM-dependent methyltransferase [Reinekea sp.]
MSTLYANSWKLYKAVTEFFSDDIAYYKEFIGNTHSLELFAGYGRVTNQLVEQGASIETVEILPEFSQFIELPANHKHVCNVLDFQPEINGGYQRIFAAYNSFCLLTDSAEIQRFFHLLETWLQPNGLASLNYYHPDYWNVARQFNFQYKGQDVHYRPSFDLSNRHNGVGRWIYEFELGDDRKVTYKYNTRIYETIDCLNKFLQNTTLVVESRVDNFNINNPMGPGWVDFILKKKA